MVGIARQKNRRTSASSGDGKTRPGRALFHHAPDAGSGNIGMNFCVARKFPRILKTKCEWTLLRLLRDNICDLAELGPARIQPCNLIASGT
jgi:hypothetical protein